MSSLLRYKLTEENFLEFQIYSSIRSEHQRSQRLRMRIVTTLILGGIGFYELASGSNGLAYYFFAATAILFVLHHRYTLWKYKRHFLKHIREHRKGMIGIEFSLKIADNQIHSQSEADQSILNPTSIDELVDLEEICIVTLKQSQSLIIPKHNVLSGNPKELISELSQITNLPLIDRRNLKWR